MKAVNKNKIIIKPFPVVDEGPVKSTQTSMEDQVKKQNKGTVVLMGKGCDDWIQPGDTVSFYRNAATSFKDDDDGEDYVILHEDHVLVQF